MRAHIDPAFLGTAAIEAAVTLVLLGVVLDKQAFDVGDPIVLLSLAYRLAFELAFYLTGVFLLLKVSPSRIPAASFASLCLFVTLLDAGVYLYGNTRLRHGLLDLVIAYSLRGFLSPSVYALSAAFLAAAAGSVALMPAVRSRLSWSSVVMWALLLAAVAAAGELNRYPMESLSLELIGAHNAGLPVEPAPSLLGTPVAHELLVEVEASTYTEGSLRDLRQVALDRARPARASFLVINEYPIRRRLRLRRGQGSSRGGRYERLA